MDIHNDMICWRSPDWVLLSKLSFFRHASVSSPYPCQSVGWSVSWLVGDTFETAGVKRNSITDDDLSCCSELPESKDGNASGVHEGLNARAMYMKA